MHRHDRWDDAPGPLERGRRCAETVGDIARAAGALVVLGALARAARHPHGHGCPGGCAHRRHPESAYHGGRRAWREEEDGHRRHARGGPRGHWEYVD